MASNDPLFEEKAADVLGLYLHPPQHALVLCVDEKTAIQALDRTDPTLPLSPGRDERHGFERSSSRPYPNMHLHFTPTYSSWLNQVELWFAKIERDLIYPGVFTPVKDLAKPS